MIEALPLFHRIAGRPVIVVGEGDAAAARRRLVERAGGIVAGEDDQAAQLAFVALDAPEDVAARLRARGLLINVADRPDLCDFTAPSILDRSPVLVAIGTGGASAGLAKALRLRLEALLPASLGSLAQALSAARTKLRARWPDAGERRRALDVALGEGGVLDPLRAISAERVDEWLSDRPGGLPGGVVEIWLRTADPEDLTLREARLLGSADILAHEPGVPVEVLERARADAARVTLATGEAAPADGGLVVVLRAKFIAR
jgi:uroporphyrin-III C-methyltransferase/precorrin-2 dehydrogenase/sirohydrochlorin ferrochelatase